MIRLVLRLSPLFGEVEAWGGGTGWWGKGEQASF